MVDQLQYLEYDEQVCTFCRMELETWAYFFQMFGGALVMGLHTKLAAYDFKYEHLSEDISSFHQAVSKHE